MAERSGYAGRVKNNGSQSVKAPYQSEKKNTGSVKRGQDLRAGVKNGK